MSQTSSFELASYGPGADEDILRIATPVSDVLAQADPSTFRPTSNAGIIGVQYYEPIDDVRRLLQDCTRSEHSFVRSNGQPSKPDPTWGFYVFVTTYDSTSQEQLPTAIEHLIALTHRQLEYRMLTLPSFSAEAFKRFSLTIVKNKDELQDASDERVRAAFRRVVRASEVSGEDPNNLSGDSVPDSSLDNARHAVCLVVDHAAIATLAGLSIDPNPKDDEARFESITLKVVDIHWDSDEHEGRSYRGVGLLSVLGLARFWHLITSASNSGAMEDMHPLAGYPD